MEMMAKYKDVGRQVMQILADSGAGVNHRDKKRLLVKRKIIGEGLRHSFPTLILLYWPIKYV